MMKPNNILRLNWEPRLPRVIVDIKLAQQLISEYNRDEIKLVELIPQGSANTNYKIVFKKNIQPLLLRIYVRDKHAIKKEVNIYKMIAKSIPTPKVLYINNTYHLIQYPYAIIQWNDGVLMRKVILNSNSNKNDIIECAHSAGMMLNKIRSIVLPCAGFFDDNMDIIPFTDDQKYLSLLSRRLADKTIQTTLGHHITRKLQEIKAEYAYLLPKMSHTYLVHGDYTPRNLLVKKREGKWHVTTILDWEFAFSGSYYFDIGIMLRYAHRLPNCYLKGFMDGLCSTGQVLPHDWKRISKLADLLNLLNLLHFNPRAERPNMVADIVLLIEKTITYFKTTSLRE